MHKVLDQTGDLNGQQTYRLLTLYNTPQFVKEASSEDLLGENLAVAEYADPVHRRFPCHTKAATLLSALFLWDNIHQLPKKDAATIEYEIEKKAAFHNIKQAYTELKNEYFKKASNPYKDLSDDQFALIIKLPDGTVERHYPLRNPMEVKAASQHMLTHQDVIPLAERQRMAQRILDKAAEYGASLGNLEEYTNKQAGYGVCASSDAADMLRSRVMRLRRDNKYPEIQEHLEKMATTCEENTEQVRGRHSLLKLAAIIDELDRATGLDREYGTNLERPEDVLFGVTEKVANQFVTDCCSTITGSMYKVADLANLKLDDIRDVFGDDFADSVSTAGLYVSPQKMAEQLPVLPRPDAQIIDRLLSQAGVKPFAKEAANNTSEWQDRSFLRKLARQ